MTTGDAADITLRLQRWLPTRWFPTGPGTRLWATLNGFAAGLAAVYAQAAYAGQQSRIGTATDAFLDLAAADWLGAFPRRLNELDAAYAARIQREIVRPRNTRAAVVRVVRDLTGTTPTVVNPASTADCGGWNTGFFAWDAAGCWGDTNLPFQTLVTVKRGNAAGAGVDVTFPYAAGGWDALGGWDAGTSAWVDSTPAQEGVTDNDIYAAIRSVTPCGHVFWTRLTN